MEKPKICRRGCLGSGGVTSTVVFKNHGDGVLRYLVNRHGGDGLELVISVVFPTLIFFGSAAGGRKQE